MARTDSPENASVPRRALRTVTPPYRGRRDWEMDAIGWSILLGMLILLVPLLPFLIVVWLVDRVIEFLHGWRR